jgi:hypothetical protein
MVHVPMLTSVAVAPDIVHTAGVVEAKLTARPEDAVALSVNGEVALLRGCTLQRNALTRGSSVEGVVGKCCGTHDAANRLRNEADAQVAARAGRQREAAVAIGGVARACHLHERIRAYVQAGGDGIQCLVPDVLDRDRLRAVSTSVAHGSRQKTQGRRLRPLNLYDLAAVVIRDEDITGSIHPHTGWLVQSADRCGLGAAPGRNLHYLVESNIRDEDIARSIRWRGMQVAHRVWRPVRNDKNLRTGWRAPHD